MRIDGEPAYGEEHGSEHVQRVVELAVSASVQAVLVALATAPTHASPDTPAPARSVGASGERHAEAIGRRFWSAGRKLAFARACVIRWGVAGVLLGGVRGRRAWLRCGELGVDGYLGHAPGVRGPVDESWLMPP